MVKCPKSSKVCFKFTNTGALNSQIQALQILKNDDEVENWSLSSFFLAVLCVINKFLNLRGFYVEWELWKVNENFCIWLDHFQSINSKFISLWRSNRFWISSGENGRKKMCLEKILDLSRSDCNDPLKTITVSAILRLSLFRSY